MKLQDCEKYLLITSKDRRNISSNELNEAYIKGATAAADLIGIAEFEVRPNYQDRPDALESDLRAVFETGFIAVLDKSGIQYPPQEMNGCRRNVNILGMLITGNTDLSTEKAIRLKAAAVVQHYGSATIPNTAPTNDLAYEFHGCAHGHNCGD